MNFYKHHLGDYDGHTMHLTWLQDMAYTRLIRVYCRRERPITTIPEAIRLCRAVTAAEKQAVRSILDEFFTEATDGFHNTRCDEEIVKYQAQSSTNRRIARERTVNEPSNDSSTKRTPNQIPDTKNQNPEKTKPTVAALPEWLDIEAWTAYFEMRKKIRKPMTARAEALIIKKLEKLKDEGNDPASVLDQSTMNAWQGLFPLKAPLNGSDAPVPKKEKCKFCSNPVMASGVCSAHWDQR